MGLPQRALLKIYDMAIVPINIRSGITYKSNPTHEGLQACIEIILQEYTSLLSPTDIKSLQAVANKSFIKAL